MHDHGRSRKAGAVALAALLLVSAVLGMPDITLGADPASEAAAHLARQRGGAPSAYRLLTSNPSVSDGAGGSMWVGKFADAHGVIHVVYRDGAGRMSDAAAHVGRLHAAASAGPPLQAKADAALRARVAEVGPAESVPVAVWLDVDVTQAVAAIEAAHPEVAWLAGRPEVSSLEQARSLRAELWEAKRVVYAEAADQLADEVAALGGSLAYASEAAPIAFVDLPARAAEKLAALATVRSIGLERTWTTTMTTAAPTVDANWTSGSGDQGTGVRVAVVEYHNVRNSGDLAGRVVASHSSTGRLAYTGSGQFDHPTWVAGAIAGGGTYGGTAPGSQIVTASTGGGAAGLTRDRAVIATTDWAVSPSGGDADIVNVSLIQDTSTGQEEARRYFDSVVDEDLRVIVAASGNYSALGNWRVGSPGTGWNVLTVGGTDDRNTASRADDRMWYVPGSNGSSYLDPPGTAWNPHGDFNKPNLSAPAVGVRTANGLAASGTSVATPIVSGLAAQLIARAPILTSWPETVRALLMAGAVHRTRMPNGSLNADHEGVGSASALWSNRILTVGDSMYGGYRHGLVSTGFAESIQVAGGGRLKVALTWNSRTTGSGNLSKTDTLASDLDLRVRLPNGTILGSYSLDNSYETVDITTPHTGTVILEVVGARVASGSERFALAWTKIGGDRTPPRVTARGPEAGEPWAAPSVRPTIAFSEPMTGLTYFSVRLSPAAGGSDIPVTLSNSASARRITMTPNSPLAPGAYRITLTDYLRDHAWNRLAPESWTFSVASQPGSPSGAVSPSRRATFAAGTHTGYRFDSAGRVTASRSGTLSAPSGASVDWRGTVPGQPGVWLRIVNGGWAGYLIRESSLLRLPGTTEQRALPSTTRVTFGAGSHTGYRYAANGSVTESLTGSVSRTSGANTTARAVVNGRWHLLISNGIWAGYWVPETARSFLPGAVDHRDMANGTVRFSAGSHGGYRYAADGTVVGYGSGVLAGASSAPAISWAIVNGAPRFLIGAGMLSGLWVSESGTVRRP